MMDADVNYFTRKVELTSFVLRAGWIVSSVKAYDLLKQLGWFSDK